MDKYTKVVLTIIAICLVSLNIYIWKPEKVLAHIDGAPSTAAQFTKEVHLVVERDCFVSKDNYRNFLNKGIVCINNIK
jgi:uncharacterized protein YoxC